VCKKIAFRRIPRLRPLVLRRLDVVIQFEYRDGLVRLIVRESKVLYQTIALISPHVDVPLRENFHLIVHHLSSCL